MNALSRLLARFTFLRWVALPGLMLGAASSALAAGNTSPSFNLRDGTVTTAVGSSGSDMGNSVTVQADGKILVVGNSDSSIGLVRYNTDASLDTSFGTGGKVTTSFGPGSSVGNSVTVQSDGKILIAGTGNNGQFALARYSTAGSLDTSFGTGGKVTTNIGWSAEGQSITMQTDGKIVVAGFVYYEGGFGTSGYSEFALARYNNDGSLDTSFNTNGQVTFPFGFSSSGKSVTVQMDGQILVAGNGQMTGNGSFALARFNTDGSFDASFDSDGKVTTSFASSSGFASSVTVQPDGKILVAGATLRAYQSDFDFAIVRHNTDGSLDASFGTDGKATTDFAGRSDIGYSVAVQTDGKILVAGTSCTLHMLPNDVWVCGSDSYLGVARYNGDGSLDTGFGAGGMATIPSGQPNGNASVSLQTDGKALVAGTIASGNKTYFGLVRFNTDGTPDAGFNPRTSLDNNPSFTEGGSAVILDSAVTVYDAELSASNYSGSTVTLGRHGGANLEDVFSAGGSLGTLNEGSVLTLSGIIVGTVTKNAGGTLSLLFNSNATQTRVNQTLSSIQYANTSHARPPSVVIDWTFNDGNTGAQGSGGALATTDSITVTILGVNDPPTGKDTTVTMNANSTYALQGGDFGFIDAEDGSTLTAVRINSLPTAGALRYGGALMVVGLDITAAELAAGNLTFTPVANAIGSNYGSIGFSVKDSSGAYAISSNTLTFTVITVPGVPTNLVAAPGNSSAILSFIAPSSNGGAAISGYKATCGTATSLGTSSPITVAPLNNGTTYACSVLASNTVGDGAPSSTANVTPVASTGTLITRYRLYSDYTKEHLYTTGLNEYNVLPVCCGWIPEGAIYKVFDGVGSLSGVDAVQYYRLYNPLSYQHHWTTDLNEYNVLGTRGWTKEGVDGYILPTAVSGSVPLYRLYLNAFGGLHLWTTDANEKNVLSTSNGWVDEGVAGWVVPLP